MSQQSNDGREHVSFPQGQDGKSDGAIICGLTMDLCVAWTALDARKLGFAAAVIDDACHAIDMQGSLAAAWEKIDRAGVNDIESRDVA